MNLCFYYINIFCKKLKNKIRPPLVIFSKFLKKIQRKNPVQILKVLSQLDRPFIVSFKLLWNYVITLTFFCDFLKTQQCYLLLHIYWTWYVFWTSLENSFIAKTYPKDPENEWKWFYQGNPFCLLFPSCSVTDLLKAL